jgi:hypothetical protein
MRKGRGIGQGKGYKNIIPTYDSHRHSLNAQGYKMPQRLGFLFAEHKGYQGTYGRQIHNVKRIIGNLKKAKLSDVTFTGKHIKLFLNGKEISYSVKYNKTVKNIGNWGHSLSDNRIFLDKDIPQRYKPQLAVHEAIEQYVSEKHGLKYPEAHEIAEHFEKQYAKSHGISWVQSEKAILNTKI